MNIGFDAKRFFNNQTGLGNYSRDLVRGLLENCPENHYHLFTPSSQIDLQTKFLKSHDNVKIHEPSGINKSFKSYWRSIGLEKDLKKNNIDIFHGLSHEMPKKKKNSSIKYIVTVHDLIFLKFPENYKAIDRKIYEKKVKYAVEHADKIIAISQQTKKDLIELLNVPQEKIEVVYQACSSSFNHHTHYQYIESVRKKYNLPENFILNVGTVEKRKNVASLVEAVGKSSSQLPLVIVGSHTSYLKEVEEKIAKYELDYQVAFLQNVSFLDLPAIYQMSNLFVYPSVYEGFGIPILEALYSKTPVIAATGSCLEEAGGPSTIYVDPFDTDQMAFEIDRIITSVDDQLKMKEQGYLYAQNFTNKKQAEKLNQIYHQL